MNGDTKYWLKEAYRHLGLSLIGSSGKVRKHIDKALECLERYEKQVDKGKKK